MPADDETREAVLTALENLEPNALPLESVEAAVHENEEWSVSEAKIEDALGELEREGRVERLSVEDGPDEYRIT